MTIDTIKTQIENGTYTKGFYIYQYKDNDWLARQYVHHIRTICGGCDVCESIDELADNDDDIWGMSEHDSLKVFFTDCFECDEASVSKNAIVVTKKISDKSGWCTPYIIDLPSLTDWDIKDYIASSTNLSNENIESLYKLTLGDVDRVGLVVNKIKIFPEAYHNELFETLVKDGEFEDLSEFSILNLSTAILKRDTRTVKTILDKIDVIDVNIFALTSLLYSNFKHVVDIQLSSNPTPESTGLKSNQFWAIKMNNIGYYSTSELINIMYTLSVFDTEIKLGNISSDMSIDYLITLVMGGVRI